VTAFLAEALNDVIQDRRLGQRVSAQTTREVAELLQLVANASTYSAVSVRVRGFNARPGRQQWG
jgi:hypothetical protein